MSTETSGLGEPSARCPVADWFDPNQTAAHTDPFPWYHRLRQEGPVVFMPSVGMYAVTRHEEILEILRDTATFSNAEGLGEFRPLPPAIREQVGEDWSFPDVAAAGLTVMDPPRHTRLRKIVAPALTPRRMAVHEPAIREIAHSMIDEFVDQGHADLASQLAYRLPSRVIGRIIGAEDETSDRFVDWVDAFFRLRLIDMSEADEIRCWRLLLEYERFCRGLIDDRRQHPQDDLTTDLIYARANAAPPSSRATPSASFTSSSA